MKCATHNQDATAICAHCGVGLCPTCARVPAAQRTACSEACAQALTKADRAIDTILLKSSRSSPGGRFENSPPFQGWDCRIRTLSLEGTAEFVPREWKHDQSRDSRWIQPSLRDFVG